MNRKIVEIKLSSNLNKTKVIYFILNKLKLPYCGEVEFKNLTICPSIGMSKIYLITKSGMVWTY